jgi:DNA-binding HxlR family transcriptional regulator
MPYTIKKLPNRAAERAIKVIAGAWKPRIIELLLGGPKRLSELRKHLLNVSQKVLVQQLRELEEHGLVHRTLVTRLPLRVDYSATPLAHSLVPVLRSLHAWGCVHAAKLSDSIEGCPRP